LEGLGGLGGEGSEKEEAAGHGLSGLWLIARASGRLTPAFGGAMMRVCSM
jgi:hypothetical protein